MAIDEVIPEQGFELIRDAIASILITELASQAILQPDAHLIEILQNTTVWKERLGNIGAEETFIVLPILFSATYDNQSIQDAEGSNTFFLDCYGRGKQNDSTPEEQVAAIDLQRLIGIIRNIFEHPLYIRLGFEPGFVTSSHITSIQRTQIEKQEDGANMTMYRITMLVKASEVTSGIPGIPLDQSYTSVLINDTNKGLEYLIDLTP